MMKFYWFEITPTDVTDVDKKLILMLVLFGIRTYEPEIADGNCLF
jgi:hypothetical protein